MSETMTVSITCDVCHKEIWSGDPKSSERPKKADLLVWFDTEQEEGRFVKPYLCMVSMNICDKCAEDGIRIHAVGAMGRNDYKILGR